MKKVFFAAVLAVLVSAKVSLSAETVATSDFRIFEAANIVVIAPEFTGYVAVAFRNSANETYWMHIDPTVGTDGGKGLLSTLLTAKSTGTPVDVVYWRSDSGLSHSFQCKNWVISNRRIHTVYVN
jgi:maltose-binding protein MalE